VAKSDPCLSHDDQSVKEGHVAVLGASAATISSSRLDAKQSKCKRERRSLLASNLKDLLKLLKMTSMKAAAV
jgi:hypothetical protein